MGELILTEGNSAYARHNKKSNSEKSSLDMNKALKKYSKSVRCIGLTNKKLLNVPYTKLS